MAQGIPLRTLTVGTSGVGLDIFFQDRNTNQTIDPVGITFTITDPLSNLVIGTSSGVRVEPGRYDARNAIIPSSGIIGEGWTIYWSVSFPGSVSGNFSEDFAVQLASISATFSSPTVDTETIYDRVRLDVGDPNAQIFNDGLLQRVLAKSIARLNRRLGIVEVCQHSSLNALIILFSTNTPTVPITVNFDTGIITPNTDPYVDILTLQMEEILMTAEASNMKRLNVLLGGPFGSGISNMQNEGVAIRNADGVSIDVAVSRFVKRADMFKWDAERIAKELELAIKDFRWRLSACNGIDVTMPRYWYPRFGFGRSPYR